MGRSASALSGSARDPKVVAGNQTAACGSDGGGEYVCHHEDCRRRFVRKTSLTNHLKAHQNVKSRSIYRTKRARMRAAAAAELRNVKDDSPGPQKAPLSRQAAYGGLEPAGFVGLRQNECGKELDGMAFSTGGDHVAEKVVDMFEKSKSDSSPVRTDAEGHRTRLRAEPHVGQGNGGIPEFTPESCTPPGYCDGGVGDSYHSLLSSMITPGQPMAGKEANSQESTSLESENVREPFEFSLNFDVSDPWVSSDLEPQSCESADGNMYMSSTGMQPRVESNTSLMMTSASREAAYPFISGGDFGGEPGVGDVRLLSSVPVESRCESILTAGRVDDPFAADQLSLLNEFASFTGV